MISIIVPVYKVEPYLDECVRSLVQQTYGDLEILLVDDGSPDRCGTMCDDWVLRDSRIRVIHQKNGGLSDARNAGIAAARGEYIGFVDSDDHVAPNMYQNLLEHLTRTDSDLAACGVEMVWQDGARRMLTGPGEGVLTTDEAMEAIIRETLLKQPVWNKLYKRALLEGIPFEKGKCHEDIFWSYQIVARAKRVCVFAQPMYFYRQRCDSIMGEGFSAKRLDALEAKEQRLAFLEAHYPHLAQRARRDLFLAALYHLQKAHATPGADPAAMEALRHYAKKYPLRPETFKEWVWAGACRCSLDLTCKVRNALHIGM